MAQMQLLQQTLSPSDVVYTPDWCAHDIVDYFQPSGVMLDPCKGEGAFLKYMPNADWCEIGEGRDFFAYTNQVNWIISNPPFSIFDDWLEHSFSIAENIVYLLPFHMFFRAYGRIQLCRKYGWVKHIRIYGTGSKVKFPTGNAVGAVYFKRGYFGDTSWSWYAPNTASSRLVEGTGILPAVVNKSESDSPA
jgi:hypothetical protein